MLQKFSPQIKRGFEMLNITLVIIHKTERNEISYDGK